MIFPWVANFISFNIIKTPDLALEESIKSDNHKRVFFLCTRKGYHLSSLGMN